MKLSLILLFFPLLLMSQITNENKKIINIKYERGLDSLILKNQNIINKKDGILGWRVQLTFKSTKEEIKENIDDLHHDIFNTDYYIIGRYEAKKWLGDQVFNIIETIREYEEFNFGEVNTDFSEPEKVVNMYVYIIGEEIVADYRNQLEDEVA